ncbi:HAAS signaling domain-containing protein [Pseudonocardia humida]|uniref:DUF1707 domain-containing protein n=1 Tax=Pseudonocardia humida TaxID=2800819 RepID=A0ABT1A627_9PSEU|nr:hypothetical protein [Pseudonocardia humida]MCO1658471.1 hypothetical protein [Pseudonocardia humida]
MTDTLSKADRRYLEELAVHLQLRYVPGEQIGEILAEAEAHSAQSGEPLREAFGDPKEYAQQWAGAPARRRWWTAAAAGVPSGLGGVALAWGATGLAMDQRLPVLDLPSWWLIVVGTLLTVGVWASVPVNRIRDPRTGATSGRSRTTVVLLALGMCATVAAAGLVGALLR